jgi:hypothetical protein
MPGSGRSRRPEGLPVVRILRYRAPDGPGAQLAHWFELLQEHSAWLQAEDRAISVDGLADFLRGEGSIQDGSVLVTVDTDCGPTADMAWDVLSGSRLPGLIFLPVEHKDTPHDPRSAPRRAPVHRGHLAVADSVELGMLGSDAGGLAALPEDEAVGRARMSGAAAEPASPDGLRCYAYSGQLSDVRPVVRAVVQAGGYTMAFTSQHGRVTRFTDPHLIPRITVEASDGVAELEYACGGGLDALGWIDRWVERRSR